MSELFLTPEKVHEAMVEVGIKKTKQRPKRHILLGIMGGIWFALAAAAANVVSHDVASVGISRMLIGLVFPTSLALLLIAGGELMLGNNLLVLACLEKKARWLSVFRCLVFIYIGNFLGAMFIVGLTMMSSQLYFSNGMLGGYAILVSVYKTELSFAQGFSMGFLCNILVCGAVLMSFAAKDVVGKIVAIFFPIMLFNVSGYEQSIANMFFVPVGIFSKKIDLFVQTAMLQGVTAEQISRLSFQRFFANNLLPVTLGNVFGGVFLAILFWLIYGTKNQSKPLNERNQPMHGTFEH